MQGTTVRDLVQRMDKTQGDNRQMKIVVNEYSLIVGGDMNAALNLKQDISGVNHIKAQQQAVDMFRTVSPSYRYLEKAQSN